MRLMVWFASLSPSNVEAIVCAVNTEKTKMTKWSRNLGTYKEKQLTRFLVAKEADGYQQWTIHDCHKMGKSYKF